MLNSRPRPICRNGSPPGDRAVRNNGTTVGRGASQAAPAGKVVAFARTAPVTHTKSVCRALDSRASQVLPTPFTGKWLGDSKPEVNITSKRVAEAAAPWEALAKLWTRDPRAEPGKKK